MTHHVRIAGVLLIAAVLLAGGCEQPAEQGEPNEPTAADEVSPDVRHARALWTQIEDYENWPEPEGFEGWQEGTSPHGSVLRYYVNEVAAEDPTADGAIVVKENYSAESDDALMSVTVMEKREGYDAETGDWFYVKYAPDGEVMANPAGKHLAGLVGKGGAQGCIPCHANAEGGDYVFIND